MIEILGALSFFHHFLNNLVKMFESIWLNTWVHWLHELLTICCVAIMHIQDKHII
jgi:hypothetical protein